MDIKHTFKVEVGSDKSSGFSLVELVIVAGILVMITGTMLVNYSSFNNSIILGSLAYDIALSIRQAQVFGLSVRAYKGGSGPATFDIGYGVHFEAPLPTKSYILFADTDRDFNYNALLDGDIDVFTIGRGNFISEFCTTNSSDVERCASTADITKLDIVFGRPDPEAIIKTDYVPPEVYGSVRIVVSSPQGNERVIRVFSTGQITVESP